MGTLKSIFLFFTSQVKDRPRRVLKNLTCQQLTLPDQNIEVMSIFMCDLNLAHTKYRKWFTLAKQNVAFIIITLETHLCMSTIFLLFATLRVWQFHRICFFIEALKYIYTSSASLPRISGR